MKKTENFTSLLIFIFTFSVYTFTASRTINFWDSSEFITTNLNLEATHSPGAPFYTLLSSFILLFFPVTWSALICNLISSLFGSLTVVFLFKISYMVCSKMQNDSLYSKWISISSGTISALTLAFSTSFWTASTETEVYTLSSFLLLLSFYIALLWSQSKDEKKSKRLILFFSFLLGISVGVHLINLSVIVPLSVLYAHKKKNENWKFIGIYLLASVILFFCIYLFGIQGFLKTSSVLDIFLVNRFSFPVNSGLLISILGLLSICFVLLLKVKNNKLKFIVLSTLLFFIGGSSYLLPILRNNVSTPFSYQIKSSNDLLNYIQAKQFGVDKIPLLYGTSFNAPLDKITPFVDGRKITSYNDITKKYEVVDDGYYSIPNYADEFKMLFPRMYSQNSVSSIGYRNWATINGEKFNYSIKGKIQEILKPTFSENLAFFYNYQINWLYFRYLGWNFIGRQNTIKGTGDIFNGNWKSGINTFDKFRIGEEIITPEAYKKDKSNDGYYFLPFILGLIGLFAIRKSRTFLLVTLLFFLTFGIGIIIYVNPLPESILIRERDYIFLGSFIIFSLWVGLSLIQIIKWLTFFKNKKIKLAFATIIVSLFAPIQLLAKNFDNHQRSKDTFAYDLGKAYLQSCPQNAILITNGDNFSFSLWYLQEVENFRTDVRIINFDQLNLEFFIDKLNSKNFNALPVNHSLTKNIYIEGKSKLIPFQKETNQSINVNDLIGFLNNEKSTINWNGKQQHYIPNDIFNIQIDSSKIAYSNLINTEKLNAKFITNIEWRFTKEFYQINELILLDIIQNNLTQRPICFSVNGKTDHYIGLQNHTIQNGFVEILYPIIRKEKGLNPKIVDTENMFPLLNNEITFNGIFNQNEIIESETIEYSQSIIRRNYYFLAQALAEEGKINEAKTILDNCINLLPNEKVLYKQYAFALGRLYFRIGEKEKGMQICNLAINNIWNELNWITSFNPKNPIINVKQGEKLMNMYSQMLQQYPGDANSLEINPLEFTNFMTYFNHWKIKNWPY
ncbi:glycosyltransferase family 117 protein [Flavobacterium okayamense]|nr:DUF2723 domain-containing protein [Flavobacterium okayamense]